MTSDRSTQIYVYLITKQIRRLQAPFRREHTNYSLFNEATIRACRLVGHAVSLRGVPYSREVARFALFGGRLPKVKVLTADVPINVICVVLWVGRVFLRLQNKKR